LSFKQAEAVAAPEEAKPAEATEEKTDEKKKAKADIYKIRQRHAKIEAAIGQQFGTNRLLGTFLFFLLRFGQIDRFRNDDTRNTSEADLLLCFKVLSAPI
jgi:hypothetical protein